MFVLQVHVHVSAQDMIQHVQNVVPVDMRRCGMSANETTLNPSHNLQK